MGRPRGGSRFGAVQLLRSPGAAEARSVPRGSRERVRSSLRERSDDFTSPRLRGEVGDEATAKSPGEGDSPRVRIVERAPHPHPLPAKGGARERLTANATAAFPAN